MIRRCSRHRVDEKLARGGFTFSMSLSTFKIGKKEYVILPRKRYEQLTRDEQDRIDAEIVRKGRAAYLSGKTKTISHAELKRKLAM